MLYRTIVRWVCVLSLAASAQAAPPALDAAQQTQLAAIAKEVFKGQPMPPDMLAMCSQQLRREAGKRRLRYDPWADIDAACLTPKNAHEPRDTSYLSEKERQDPEVAAIVKATHEVMSHISFVAKTGNSDFVGYWQWPKGTPMARARIVIYDTEGQFSLSPGRTVTEALLLDGLSPDEDGAQARYQRVRKGLEQLGAGTIPPSYQALADQAPPAPAVHPAALQDQLIKRYRSERR